MSIAEIFGDYVVKARFEDLPDEVIKQAKRSLLDYLGVAVAGYKYGELSRIVLNYLCHIGGREECTIIGKGVKVPCSNAALANGVFGHALDWDDGHRYGGVHPSVCVIPAALAVAEYVGANGRDLINAIVLGYEILLRVAYAVNVNTSQILRGFHATGTCGPFGAAVSAAKLLGLDEEQTLNAIAIAGLQGAGLQEMLHEGPMIKPLQPGKAAQSGVLAAFLAREGAVGPKTIFEGDKGFVKAFTDSCDFDIMVHDLGEDFEILKTYTKPYPTCRNMHPAIDLSLALGREYDIHPDEIKEIHVKTYHIAIKETGNIWEPQDATEAKFSMPYSVAVTLIKRSAGLKEFSEPTVSDRDVLKLTGKVRIERDERMERNYPAVRGAEVTVMMENGSSYTKREDLPKGEPENPLTDEELKKKFLYCTEEVFDAEQAPLDIDDISAKSDTQRNYLMGRAEEIIRIIESLEETEDVNTLISMLSRFPLVSLNSSQKVACSFTSLCFA